MSADLIALAVTYPFTNTKDRYDVPAKVTSMKAIETTLTTDESIRNVITSIIYYDSHQPESETVEEQLSDISAVIENNRRENKAETNFTLPNEIRDWTKEIILNAAHEVFNINDDGQVTYVDTEIAVLCVGIEPNLSYQMFTGGMSWGDSPTEVFDSLLILSYTKAFEKAITE